MLITIGALTAPVLLGATAGATELPITTTEVTVPEVPLSVPETGVTVPDVPVTVPTVTVPPLPTAPLTTTPAAPTTTATAPAASTPPGSRDASGTDVHRSGPENGGATVARAGSGSLAPTVVTSRPPTLAAAARQAAAPFAVPLGVMLLIAAYVVLRGMLDRRDTRLASAPVEDRWVGFR